MMANAMGPQNTVGAIGMRPSTVETAVSMSGRKRDALASSTASRTGNPDLRSASICEIRITAFFAIIPSKARMPRIATNPSGRSPMRSASTTPMSPSGSSVNTIATRRKLPSATISTITISVSMSGMTANTDALELALSSAIPPRSIR